MTPREPLAFPPAWADAWGDDRFGLWAEFALKGVTQRMRWIEPGEFWMGSPENEPERFVDEGPRHRVRLTRGFWLADSACTQALWLAVSDTNPSRFSDDPQNPVERVGWDDVQRFLNRLNHALPELSALALPTEAEWEYACRAGTEGPFNLGEQITPRQVNYNGNRPYADGAKGRFREKTVPVKVLPPNAWGLYEMHGNVWEWCDDAMRKYTAVPEGEAVVDPQGPREQGPEAPRAVRGGSWIGPAGYARSAYRYVDRRGVRNVNLGCRLALRF